MRAIAIREPGAPEVLVPIEAPDPIPGHGELLIWVAAAGVNRPDLHQREGNYPPPPGAPAWPGLEVSGIVAQLGEGVTDFAVGDRVCALLAGGGYAELAVCDAGLALRVPDGLDLVEAAGLPEALATVWSNVFLGARLSAGETLLVHGGASGIGTMAVQLARAFGAEVAVTASSPDKLEACARLGASILINYGTEDFVQVVRAATKGRGVDVILDPVGGDYLGRNVRALAPHGRIVLIANQSGSDGVFSIGQLMTKWATISGSVLRGRPLAEKREIMASVRASVLPLLESGEVVPVIQEILPLSSASEAHRLLEAGAHVGKFLLVP